MTRSDPRFKAALEAVKRLCSLFPATISKQANKSTIKNAKRTMNAIVTRAVNAPQIAANWGPQGLIVFYSSKAAEALGKPQGDTIVKYILGGNTTLACHNLFSDRSGDKNGPGPEALAYIAYTAALYRVLSDSDLGILARPTCSSASRKFLDTLVEAAVNGQLKPSMMVYLTELLGRLIVIYFQPVINRLEELNPDKAPEKDLVETIHEMCTV